MNKVLNAIISIFLVFYLVYVQKYASGYTSSDTSINDSRSTLYAKIIEGYKLDNAEWAFGYAILPIIIVLLWITRKRFLNKNYIGNWQGVAFLLLGLFIYFVGYKANEKYLGFVSIQVFVAGLVVWFGGWKLFKDAFWLWVLFGMLWPLIPLIPVISFPLQKVMALLTTAFLKVIGEDVVRNGTAVLSAPGDGLEMGERFSLKVAAACSGLRSLFALIMLSLVVGYWSLKKHWQIALLVGLTLPIAVLANLVRMVMLYVGTISWGSEFAIGKGEHDPSAYHIIAGLVVFVVAIFLMMSVVGVFQRGKLFTRKKIVVNRVD